MKIVIIGSGIAGAVASGYFSSYGPKVFEARQKGETWNHRAIMRLRSQEIGYLLGCPLERVKVAKAIYYDGKYFNEPNLSLQNSYSIKVTGGISERSIKDIGDVERFLLKKDFAVKDTMYGHKLAKVKKSKLTFVNGHEEEYDVCLSTIPMPALLGLDGIEVEDYGVDFSLVHKPIYITQARVNIPCSVVQTIYYPDKSLKTYRASLERDKLIIEAQYGFISDEERKAIINSFGLEIWDCCEFAEYKQDYGKISEIDDHKRKAIILQLTELHNIYSVGRFALWKNITTEHLLGDLKKIDAMIHIPRMAGRYYMKADV